MTIPLSSPHATDQPNVPRASLTPLSSQPAPLGDSLRIAVVGAGVAGLCTALALARVGFKHVDIYEGAAHFGEIGAGIQVAPNMSAVLERLGVLEAVTRDSVALAGIHIRRCTTNEVLSASSFAHLQQAYRYPQMVCHRADLSRTLYEACLATDVVQLHFDSRLCDVDFAGTRFCIASGNEKTWHEADVLLAADGVKSVARARMLALTNQVDYAEDTGQAAYRVLLTREQMSTDPELLDLLESDLSHRWTGLGRMIITYPIAAHNVYNVVTTHPDTHFASAPSSAWTSYGSRKEMLETYEAYCPTVQKLLQLVRQDQVCEWKLRVHAPLDTWVAGCIALVGDACHPTLPHLAQGAAQAVEDAAVLATVLARIESKDEVPKAMRLYEILRKDRAEWLVEAAANSSKNLLQTDKSELEARDRLFANSHETGRNPDYYADKEVQRLIFSHDCVNEVYERWEELWPGA